MTCWQLFLTFLGFLVLVAANCPPRCRCGSNIIDCMSRALTEENLPSSFNSSTRTLILTNNQLTAIPNGLFDNLKSLQSVYLWGNPWDCNCNILYLRSWLQWQQNRTFYRDVTCTAPSHLQGRIIPYLTEDEIISTCQYWYCNVAFITQVCLFVFILVQAVLLGFVIFYLRRFQRLANEARRTTTEIYQNVDTWPASKNTPNVYD